MSAQHPALFELLRRSDVSRLLNVLDGKGEETRIVGGAVRDALLDREVLEVDLATTALPEVVMRRAREAGLRTIPTGIAHGTVTVLARGKPFEVTTLRRDLETDGRHAVVAFGRDFDADAQRRDFTINALSLSRDGKLHDPVGGLADLRAGRVRFIGDARLRIREDFLRILRLFRFHASFGTGPLDAQARDAAIAGRHGLARLSAERIHGEMAKLLVAPGAQAALADMNAAGILGLILGGVAHLSRFARVAAIEARVGLPAIFASRLAAIAVLVREDGERLRERLRLSNAVTRHLAEVSRILEEDHGLRAPDAATIDALLFRNERGPLQTALVILHAQSAMSVHDPLWLRAHEQAAQAPKPSLPVTGGDLLSRGVPAGRELGAMLKALQAQWIRAGFPRDPVTIGRLVDEAIGAGGLDRDSTR